MSIEMIIFFILMIVAIIARTVLFLTRSKSTEKEKSGNTYINTDWQSYERFKKDIKTEGLKYENRISYCNNTIVPDDETKRLFISTPRIRDGRLIKYNDIETFRLYRDGKVIDKSSSKVSGYQEKKFSDLHITITLKDGSEMLLPLLVSPAAYEYAYNRALKVADEIISVLEKATSKI